MERVYPVDKRYFVRGFCSFLCSRKNSHVVVGVIRKIKKARDWFGRICVVFSTSVRCSQKRSADLLPVSPMQIFMHSAQVIQQMTFVEMHIKWSVTLTDRLGPEILTVLEIKGQVLLSMRLHLKVPGWFHNQKSRPKLHFSTGYTLSTRN